MVSFFESCYSIQVVKYGSSTPSTVKGENKGVRFSALGFKRGGPAANVKYPEYLQGQLFRPKRIKFSRLERELEEERNTVMFCYRSRRGPILSQNLEGAGRILQSPNEFGD